MNILLRILVLAVSVFVAAKIIPGIEISDVQTLFVVAILLGVVNVFVKPILVLLTLPLTIITLGLFVLVINGLLVLLVGAIVPGFEISGILSAILFGLVVSLTSSVLSKFV